MNPFRRLSAKHLHSLSSAELDENCWCRSRSHAHSAATVNDDAGKLSSVSLQRPTSPPSSLGKIRSRLHVEFSHC